MGYSALKHAAQYTVLTLALLAGAGAEHISQKSQSIDSKVRYVRMPREPCVLPAEHREPQKPVDIPEAVYLGLAAALAVGYAANKMRKIVDARIEEKSRPDNPKYFFGDDDY